MSCVSCESQGSVHSEAIPFYVLCKCNLQVDGVWGFVDMTRIRLYYPCCLFRAAFKLRPKPQSSWRILAGVDRLLVKRHVATSRRTKRHSPIISSSVLLQNTVSDCSVLARCLFFKTLVGQIPFFCDCVFIAYYLGAEDSAP